MVPSVALPTEVMPSKVVSALDAGSEQCVQHHGKDVMSAARQCGKGVSSEVQVVSAVASEGQGGLARIRGTWSLRVRRSATLRLE